MTNTYASFKGKLKVGNRVRHNHQRWNAEAEVLEIDEEWFRTTEGCFLWTWDTGTLELLSPSPHVSIFSGIRCTCPNCESEFVQPTPSPTPAEKEEEWWHQSNMTIREIVTEAKRRGAEEAWKEAMRIAQSHTKRDEDGFQWIGHCLFINDAAEKLKSLNNPAGAGKK